MDPSSIISAPLATFPESVNDESAGSPEHPNRAVDNGEAGTVLQLPWVEPPGTVLLLGSCLLIHTLTPLNLEVGQEHSLDMLSPQSPHLVYPNLPNY